MSDEDRRRKEAPEPEAEAEQDALQSRFPDLPPMPEAPDVPKLSPKLPPHPKQPGEGDFQPGSYNKMAIAATAASSFIMPIIVLSVAGWWLDGKLHTAPWLAFTGVLVGLIAGVASLLNVIKRLE
ncbi:MAG TPA: AtpZ/AtpI family protein [Chthonomonadaceae bacterium]|nr:AtpZ/AtpI family protein [Chthonomonadaceae bacterium]